MPKLTLTMLKMSCLLSFIWLISSCTRVVGMREVADNSHSQKQAPAECIAVYREFFAYVQKVKPDLIDDHEAQNRWLSKNLRKALANNVARFGKETNVPDFPTNQTFLGVWNNPTTYSVAL